MPEASRTTLSRKYPKLYTWLSRRDQDWMEAHKPPSRKGTRAILSRVDWEGRDRQLAEAVTTAAKELRQVPGCPIRVTITAVANKIGYVLLTYRQKLPLTAQALAEVVETREAFAIRRVWWVAECYRQEGVCPARSQLVRRANVDALKALPEVQRVVEAALKMLGYNES
jgi:hypothetical protein